MTVRLAPLPPTDAIAALEARGRQLAPSWSWQDRWGEEHAEAFTVAKSAGFDVLKDLFEGLSSALKEGKTGRDFARSMMPVLAQKGWWGRKEVLNPRTGEPEEVQLGSPRRLQLIFDTNMRVSHAAGHWAAFERGKADRPYLRYVALMDGRTRPLHAAWHNTVLPVDHPWWDTHAPPCGWNCRCTLQSLSARDIDRLRAEGEALTFDAPAIEWEAFERRDGTVVEVPLGIDPGWAHNPGRHGAEAAAHAEAMADRLTMAPASLGAAAADEFWPPKALPEAYASWVDDVIAGRRTLRSAWTVGVMGRSDLALLAEHGLRPSTAAIMLNEKQLTHMLRPSKTARGEALPVDLIRALPYALGGPQAVLIERDMRSAGMYLPKLIYAISHHGTIYKIVVQLDYDVARSAQDGARAKFQRNVIITAARSTPVALSNAGTYTIINGRL